MAKAASQPKVKADYSPSVKPLPKPKRQRKKTGEVRTVTIEEHDRPIYQYVYAGVCKNCQSTFERVSYGFRFPDYCASCGVLTKTQRKKYQKQKKKVSKKPLRLV